MSLIAIITAIIAAVPAIIGVASIIVKFTATKRDDEFLAGATKVAAALSLAKPAPAVVRDGISAEELASIIDDVNDADASSTYRKPPTNTRSAANRGELDALVERL